MHNTGGVINSHLVSPNAFDILFSNEICVCFPVFLKWYEILSKSFKNDDKKLTIPQNDL